MSEYWKSTPRYWCKHCSTYVRDTRLDRANHEATGRHKGAVERSLRELHRGHERQEREKERAKREIERLNEVVAGGDGSATSSSKPLGGGAGRIAGPPPPPAPAAAEPQLTKEQRKAQLEQLVALGVSIPDELRGEMAMAGDWTVTKTRVLNGEDADGGGVEGRATGVRKRELEKTEEEKEEENVVKGLFKKQKKWGRETRRMPSGDDPELDALLSGGLVKKEAKEENQISTKKEENPGEDRLLLDTLAADKIVKEEEPTVEKEEGAEDGAEPAILKTHPDRTELSMGGGDGAGVAAAPAVMFKRRKPKNIRQK